LEKLSTLVPVVAAALVNGDGQVLMQRRRNGTSHGGLWEFPGGKVQAGEGLEDALVRELVEELGIRIDPTCLQPVCFSSEPDPPAAGRESFVILLYLCNRWHGQPRCIVGDAINWFEPASLHSLEMPPLDIPLVKALLRVI
jgi:8-oxo-dGTP diphosphatase